MTSFSLAIPPEAISAISSVCNTTQSHITFAIINNKIVVGALGSEYFKLFNTGCEVELEDMAIRIPTKVMRTLCTFACSLRLEIDAGVKLLKLVDGGIVMGVSIPLEQDFNIDLIRTVLEDGSKASEPLDISAIGELRSLITYANSGLQCKDGLAYVIGTGFMAYRLIDNKLSFIMSKENISEFVKFSNAFKHIEVFESQIYTVFFSMGLYFGCKQPRAFIDSDYDAYKSSKPIYSVRLNLSEFCSILKVIGIAKGTDPKCEFDMERFALRVDLGNNGRYAVAVGIKGEQPITSSAAVFKVSAESLKQVLSGSALKFDDVTMTVYKSFISLKVKNNDFLIIRE